MPRKPSAVLQYKLRIRETLRRKIEKAAEKNRVSANAEMARRLERTFDQEALFDVANVAEDLKIIWARYSQALDGLQEQGDLMRAADALVKAVEQNKPTAAALERTKTIISRIEAVAAKLPRKMHTTGEKP
jgi:flagellar motility protein MotE (MotC chaperone)